MSKGSYLIILFTLLITVGSAIMPLSAYSEEESAAKEERVACPADGDTCEDGPHFRLTFPDLAVDGGEIEWRDGRFQMPDWSALFSDAAFPWRLETGGRISALLLPLSERLAPMTSERGLDSFQDVTYLIGGHAYLTYKQTLQMGVYFDTGFQQVDDKVNGQRREAEFNIFRVGTDLKVKKSLPWIMEQRPLFPERNLPSFARNTSVGFGLESGAGGISLAMDGDDLTYNQKSAYIPVYYVMPKTLVSFRVFEYSSIELYAGYYMSSFNDLTTDFTIDDKRMIKGADFNAYIAGVHLNFGPGALDLQELREKE